VFCAGDVDAAVFGEGVVAVDEKHGCGEQQEQAVPCGAGPGWSQDCG
jgi:hypothetical protein